MGVLENLRDFVESWQYKEAVQLYRQTEGPPDREAASEWHYLAALALHYSGDCYGARDAARRSLDELPTGDRLMLVQFRLAYLEREIGDAGAAIEVFEYMLSTSPRESSTWKVLAGPIQHNLALCYQQRRDHFTAADHYRQAADHFRAENLQDSLCHVLQNLAWTLVDLGDPAGAQEALDEATGALAHEESREFHQVVQAYIDAVTGRHAEAMQVAIGIVGSESTNLTSKGYAAWIAGTVALQQGQLASAEEMANVASGWAAKLQHVMLMRRAQELRTKVHMERGA